MNGRVTLNDKFLCHSYTSSINNSFPYTLLTHILNIIIQAVAYIILYVEEFMFVYEKTKEA